MRPNPGRRKKINLNFYFHISLWCLKRFHFRPFACVSGVKNVCFSENLACFHSCYLRFEIRSFACVSGGKKRSFFGKFGVLCILVTFVLRFVLLPYYRRLINSFLLKKLHIVRNCIVNSSDEEFMLCHIYFFKVAIERWEEGVEYV